MKSFNLATRCLRVLLMALLPVGAVHAQDYPTRSIRIVLPYPAGGSSDVILRVVSQKLSETMRQSVVVENRPGAGGSLGTEFAARAQADGYTLLMGGSGTHGINPSLYPRLPYDPINDFAPITLITMGTNVLIVHPTVPARTVEELIAIARARPGQLTFSSAGNGSTSHLAGEMFKMVTGLDILHVPYRGAQPAITALLSGQVDLAILNIPALVPHIKAGKIRALGVASTRRSRILPDVATLIESGFPDFDASSWNGMFAPAGTPAPIVTRLNKELGHILGMPDVIARLGAVGAEAAANSPNEFAAFVRVQIARWAKAVKASGARID